MREVIVTVGPRASGKSTFCEHVIPLDPSIVEVNRDKILLNLFGRTELDPYGGGHFLAYERMWDVVKETLTSQEVTMILDVWNGNSNDRKLVIRKLRDRGATKVVAWYFTTPVEMVEAWF